MIQNSWLKKSVFFSVLMLGLLHLVRGIEPLPSDSLNASSVQSPDSLLNDSSADFVGRDQFLQIVSSDSGLKQYMQPYLPVGALLQSNNEEVFEPDLDDIIVRDRTNHLLVFIVFLNLTFLVAIIRVANGSNLRVFLKGLYNTPLAMRILGEQKTLFSPVNIQLLLISTGMLALGIFFNIEVSGNPFLSEHPTILFLCIFSALVSIYLLKFLLHYLMELVFEVKQGAVVISNHTIGSLFFFAVIFFPLYLVDYLNSGFLEYREMAMLVGGVFVLCLLYRLLRTAFLMSLNFPYPRIYLFLYLCGFEIVPWLVILKIGDQQ